MPKLLLVLSLLLLLPDAEEGQLWLSPVSTGDCVAARISAERTISLREWEKRRCLARNSDKATAARCVENVTLERNSDFVFFTDRCSEREFLIGLNGKEYRLRKVSRKRKPHYFIGTFVGEGLNVEIDNTHLLKKTYTPREPKTEEHVLDAEYAVRVTVRKGSARKTFEATLRYGR